MGNFSVATNITTVGPTTGVGVPSNRSLTIQITTTGDGVADFEVSNDNSTWFTPGNREQIGTAANGTLWRLYDTPIQGIRVNVSSITTGRVDAVAQTV